MKKYIHGGDDNTRTTVTINFAKWGELLSLLEDGKLYIPAPMSHSSDLMVIHRTSGCINILAIAAKSGQQPIGYATLRDEVCGWPSHALFSSL